MHVIRHASRRRPALATLVLFFAVVLVVAGASPVAAQDQSTATVKIYATVGEGDRLGNDARPRIQLQSLVEPRIVRVSNAGGTVPAEMRALPVGRYAVTVSHQGYAPATLELDVDPGEIIWVRAALRREVQAGGSEIVILDRWHAGESLVMRDWQLDGLPASAHMSTLIDGLVPWALVDGIDHGGTETGRRGLFGGRDGSWTWNSFVIDGIDITDPATGGRPLLYPDPRAMEAVSVTSGLAPAAVASPGAQVTFVPRRPFATPRGMVEMMGTSRGMVGDRTDKVAPFLTRVHTWGDTNAQFSLPVTEQIGAYFSGRLTRSDFYERGGQIPRDANAASLFAHVVARPTVTDEVRIVASAARTSRPLESGDAFLGRDVEERNTFAHAQARWERVTQSGTVGSVALGIDRGVLSPDLAVPVGGGVVDRVYDGPIPSPVSVRTSRRLDLAASLAVPVRRVGGWLHSLRLDASVTSAQGTTEILATPDVAELVGGVPARVWQFVPPSVPSRRRLTQVGLAIADDMNLGDHLAIDAGLRIDRWSGRAEGASTGIDKFTFSPRLAVRSNFPSHGLAAYGAVGVYHPRVPLDWLAFGDPGQETARLYRWTDPNGNRLFDPGERGEQIALAGFGDPIGSIDANIRMPKTYEWVIGGEVRLGTALVYATATIRHETSLVRGVNVGLPISAYTRFLIPDQTDDKLMIPVFNRPVGNADADRYVLTNPDEGGVIYHGLEVVYSQPITPRFRLRASALEWWCRGPMAAPGFHVNEADQGLVGELFQDPNTRSEAYGANFFDRSYVAKVSGSYLAPRDIFLSFTANYRDGQAFAGLIVYPDLVQGPYPIQSYRRGRTRFTFTMLLDARIEKRLKVGGKQAAIWVDIFNIPNMYEEVEEDPIPGPGFRASTALQPPRTFRAGFRLAF